MTFAVGALVAGAGVLATAAPASAHERSQGLNNGRGYAKVFDAPHYWIQVCDTKADNWGVRVNIHTTLGDRFAADGNGSADGCGGYHTQAWNEEITGFQVCAGENGANTECTEWIPA